jgi:hypothetical protein
MSRLTFMDETQSILQTVADELADLERVVNSGARIDPSDIRLLGECSQKARLLYAQLKSSGEYSVSQQMSRPGRQLVDASLKSQPIPGICFKD